MEDILASIRRIIADDQVQGSRPGNGTRRTQAGAAQAPHAEADRDVGPSHSSYDDVLDLAGLSSLTPEGDQSAAEQPATEQPATEQSPSRAPEHHESSPVPLQAEDDREAADAAFDRPAGHDPAARSSSRSGALQRIDVSDQGGNRDEDEGGGLLSAPLSASVMSAFETLAATVVLQNTPMLERMMRDLLRPMLKTWLDDNLPALVERLVRAEIERVARGSRG